MSPLRSLADKIVNGTAAKVRSLSYLPAGLKQLIDQ